MSDVRQTAVLDEAGQLAVRLVQEPFAEVRESYATIGFEVIVFAQELAHLVELARKARSKRMVAQNRYELESKERRDAVDAVGVWLRQLHCAGQFAKAMKHPYGEKLPKLLFTAEVSAESWSKSVDGMNPVLDNLAALGELTSIGLPCDFHARGVALYEKLDEEREDAAHAESARFVATGRLEMLLDAIVEKFEQIVAARDLVMALTGEDLPGLELSLVKSAAAPRVRQPAAPTSAETPPPTSTPIDDTTGL